MADGIFPTLISKNRDANAQSNTIHTQLSDGTNSITTTTGALDVNIKNTSVTVTGTVELGATSLAALESITVQNGAGASAVNIQDGGNSITVDGAVTVSATNLDIRNIDQTRDNILVYGNDGTTNRKIKTNASGELQVNVLTHTFTNSNALPISKNNSANTELNPIFVTSVDTGVSNTEVHNYNTGSVLADSTSNHDYTVTGTTMLLKSVIISGSGNVKFEIRTGPIGSLVTKAVGFLTGRAGDTKQITFTPPIEIPVTSTGTVRIIRTNRENQAVDVYSTIIGNDV